MALEINKISWIGIFIMIIGIGLEMAFGVIYSIEGLPVFPFMLIPTGVLITLAGFMKGNK